MDELFRFNILQEIRNTYNEKPFAAKALPGSFLFKPSVMEYMYKEFKKVYAEGSIYYASVVQANSSIYSEKYSSNCPGSVVFSDSFLTEKYPEILNDIADMLFSYKDKPLRLVPDEYKGIVEAIKSEREHGIYSSEYEVQDGVKIRFYFCPVMFFRNYLPERKLKGKIVPIVAKLNKYKTVMLLPGQFWTRLFMLEFWSE